MPRSSTWACSVEILTAYSHSTQAADLQLCRTVTLTRPRPCPETEREAPWSLRDRVDEHGIAKLITAYRDGATAASLAIAPRRKPQQRQTPPTHCRCPPHADHPRTHGGHIDNHISVARSCPALTRAQRQKSAFWCVSWSYCRVSIWWIADLAVPRHPLAGVWLRSQKAGTGDQRGVVNYTVKAFSVKAASRSCGRSYSLVGHPGFLIHLSGRRKVSEDRVVRLLELDLEYLHRAIDKFDNQRFAIRNWTVTASGALLALAVSATVNVLLGVNGSDDPVRCSDLDISVRTKSPPHCGWGITTSAMTEQPQWWLRRYQSHRQYRRSASGAGDDVGVRT